jgi:hypothetical protein
MKMKSELAAITAPTADSKNASETSAARTRKGKRRSTSGTSVGGAVRFFLSKSENNGIPLLDREFSNEPEAIIESLKTGKNYFVISEWKGLADLSKKMPLIRKEAVPSKK